MLLRSGEIFYLWYSYVRACVSADSVGVERHNTTTEDNVGNSCTAEPSVTQRSTPSVHRDPTRAAASSHDDCAASTTVVAVSAETPSRPRPVRQSTGGRLLGAGRGTTAEGGMPTDTAIQHPTRRASAPSSTSSTVATVGSLLS